MAIGAFGHMHSAESWMGSGMSWVLQFEDLALQSENKKRHQWYQYH